MEESKQDGSGQRYSYEELSRIAGQLSEQLKQANLKIYRMSDILNKLPYLFEVVRLGDSHFPVDFVAGCVDEIMDILNSGGGRDEQAG